MEQIYVRKCNDKVWKATNLSHTDVAKLMVWIFCKVPELVNEKESYTHIYDEKKKIIYEWDSDIKLWVIWNQNNKSSNIIHKRDNFDCKISYFNELDRKLHEVRLALTKRRHELNDELNDDVKISIIEHEILLLFKLMCKLKGSGYRNSVWREFLEILTKESPINWNDTSRYQPIEGGKLYDIVTNTSRMRLCTDYYTFIYRQEPKYLTLHIVPDKS